MAFRTDGSRYTLICNSVNTGVEVVVRILENGSEFWLLAYFCVITDLRFVTIVQCHLELVAWLIRCI